MKYVIFDLIMYIPAMTLSIIIASYYYHYGLHPYVDISYLSMMFLFQFLSMYYVFKFASELYLFFLYLISKNLKKD